MKVGRVNLISLKPSRNVARAKVDRVCPDFPRANRVCGNVLADYAALHNKITADKAFFSNPLLPNAVPRAGLRQAAAIKRNPVSVQRLAIYASAGSEIRRGRPVIFAIHILKIACRVSIDRALKPSRPALLAGALHILNEKRKNEENAVLFRSQRNDLVNVADIASFIP